MTAGDGLHQFEQLNQLKSCRYGQMLYNPRDQYVGRALHLYGEYSEGEVELFRQVIKPGQVVLDVGAHIGAHTLYLAHRVGPEGVVVAFEPQRILFQTLCANLAINNVTNVECRRAAAGAAPGEIRVPTPDYTQEGNFGALALGDFERGERVPVETIDGLRLARCDFIKVDVEGMEEVALRGAAGTIGRFKPLLYVENDRPEKSDGLVRFVDSLGYRMYWHRPALFHPDNFAGNPENEFEGVASHNMLCVHRSVTHKPGSLASVELRVESQ